MAGPSLIPGVAPAAATEAVVVRACSLGAVSDRAQAGSRAAGTAGTRPAAMDQSRGGGQLMWPAL